MSSGKCHLFVSGNKHEQIRSKIGDDKIWETKAVRLLGIRIDNSVRYFGTFTWYLIPKEIEYCDSFDSFIRKVLLTL